MSGKNYKAPKITYLKKLGEGAEKKVYDLGNYVLKFYTLVWVYTDSREALLRYWKIFKDDIYKQLPECVLKETLVGYYTKVTDLGIQYFPISIQEKVQNIKTCLKQINLLDLHKDNFGIKDGKIYLIDYFAEYPNIHHKILK